MYKGTNAVILDAEKKILLELRSDVPIWALPGGGVENGEAPEQAVVREVFEETGLKADVVSRVGSYKTQYMRYSDITQVFLCKVKGGKLQKSRESIKIGFFDTSQLPKPMLTMHKERIRDAVSGKENVHRLQKISVFGVLKDLDFNPLLVWKLFVYLKWRFLTNPAQNI